MAFSTMGAAGGALGGAATGAELGSIVPGVGTAVGAVAGGLIGGLGGSGLFGGGKKTKNVPQWNYSPNISTPSGTQMFQDAANQAMQYAPQFTQENIDLQNKVTPGSSAQREAALQQLNIYIQGTVPVDVQKNIQRQVAQNLGGGFNLFSGGGQAPQNFARNLGQTSLGLSQYGLSAAPTWQQLANTMVASPTQLLPGALQAQEAGVGYSLQAAGLGMTNAENAYQSQMNQYAANQLAQQNQSQLGLGIGQIGLGAFSSLQKGNYFNSLSPSGQGAQATLGGLPSAWGSSGYGAYAQDGGAYYQPGTSVMVPAFGGQ